MSNNLSEKYEKVRVQTLKLVEGLNPEDTVVQPIVDVSPPKWHLAHTTWFFENFILKKMVPGYKVFHTSFDYLFNSYYQSQGEMEHRDMRGFHPRPLLSEVINYRKMVDEQMLQLIQKSENDRDLDELLILGLNHEQQHQELLLTDLKFIWGFSPLNPVYKSVNEKDMSIGTEFKWLPVDEGVFELGYSGSDFHFDNEGPRHKVFITSFEIGNQPVTVGEYLEFIESGAYNQWQHWLHEGWQWILKNKIQAPLYWKIIDREWVVYSLNGIKPLDKNEILTHISFYEADAFARWKGFRLPTEQEWEVAASIYGINDRSLNFLDSGLFHPGYIHAGDTGFLGQVWEWTNSAYLPYPRFKPWEGDIAEYNGKFMVSQMVLRGGSCSTPADHIRLSYRNFFHPWLRWQFTGIRLAKNKD